MPTVDLGTAVGSSLKLAAPLWVASAHLAWNRTSIDAWARQGVAPAALTLKTCKQTRHNEETKELRFSTEPHLPRFGRSFYCDGPKQKELLTYDEVEELLPYAQDTLPGTQIGISVVAGGEEDYAGLAAMTTKAAFVELNLKYSFRIQAANLAFLELAPQRLADILGQVGQFAAAFKGKPIFVKIPRELDWLPGSRELSQLLDVLQNHGDAGLIVANSKKMDIPPFLMSGEEQSFSGGVICGEHLFDQTISLIQAFAPACAERRIPIVATGGMLDPEHVLMALRAGASAVQLCTAFVYYRLEYYDTLKWNLTNRVEVQGLRTLSEYVERLRTGGVAAVYAMPFQYLDDFWSKEAQQRLTTDVRRSRRMDVAVMSGRTLVEKWSSSLAHRFGKGLGMRLFLPNPDGTMFRDIQASWGLSEPAILERQARVREAKMLFETLWAKNRPAAEFAEATEDGAASSRLPDSQLRVYLHDQCPFNAVYLFDDKAYVTLYPFDRPSDLSVPAYVFFAGSKEYQRLAEAVRSLSVYAQQRGDKPLPVEPPAAGAVSSSTRS
jgi:dihydroorotate dehydrogenase